MTLTEEQLLMALDGWIRSGVPCKQCGEPYPIHRGLCSTLWEGNMEETPMVEAACKRAASLAGQHQLGAEGMYGYMVEEARTLERRVQRLQGLAEYLCKQVEALGYHKMAASVREQAAETFQPAKG
jgi:hypothetical protein